MNDIHERGFELMMKTGTGRTHTSKSMEKYVNYRYKGEIISVLYYYLSKLFGDERDVAIPTITHENDEIFTMQEHRDFIDYEYPKFREFLKVVNDE